jgi:hypothetical protein
MLITVHTRQGGSTIANIVAYTRWLKIEIGKKRNAPGYTKGKREKPRTCALKRRPQAVTAHVAEMLL